MLEQLILGDWPFIIIVRTLRLSNLATFYRGVHPFVSSLDTKSSKNSRNRKKININNPYLESRGSKVERPFFLWGGPPTTVQWPGAMNRQKMEQSASREGAPAKQGRPAKHAGSRTPPSLETLTQKPKPERTKTKERWKDKAKHEPLNYPQLQKQQHHEHPLTIKVTTTHELISQNQITTHNQLVWVGF